MSEPLTWSTEQPNPDTTDLDALPSGEIVDRIVAADATVAAAVAKVSSEITAAVDLAVAALSAGGRLQYLGAGTSGRLAVLDAAELYPTYRVGDELVQAHLAGGPAAMLKAVEGAEDDAAAGADVVDAASERDLIVGITASGRTPYVRGALARARERGISTVLISANPHAPIAELADVAILTDTGPEVVTGSTRMKAATAHKMVLNCLSTATMVRLGKTYSNLMINVLATNQKLERRTVTMLHQATGADEGQCAAALRAANGDLRAALVALVSGSDSAAVSAVLAEIAPDASRVGDPSGVRTAVERLSKSPNADSTRGTS